MPDSVKYGRGQVIEIIHSVINKVEGGHSNRELYNNVAELAQIIDDLKNEISAYKPEHVKNSHIPDATDELDAVVNATAEATHKIMGVCEEIEQIAVGIEGSSKDDITARVTQIYEACTFQDITGQRIKNVVTTLRLIEDKVDRIMHSLKQNMGLEMSNSRYEKTVSIDDEKSLLNGPQMVEQAISQDDIDKILSAFDTPQN